MHCLYVSLPREGELGNVRGPIPHFPPWPQHPCMVFTAPAVSRMSRKPHFAISLSSGHSIIAALMVLFLWNGGFIHSITPSPASEKVLNASPETSLVENTEDTNMHNMCCLSSISSWTSGRGGILNRQRAPREATRRYFVGSKDGALAQFGWAGKPPGGGGSGECFKN